LAVHIERLVISVPLGGRGPSKKGSIESGLFLVLDSFMVLHPLDLAEIEPFDGLDFGCRLLLVVFYGFL